MYYLKKTGTKTKEKVVEEAKNDLTKEVVEVKEVEEVVEVKEVEENKYLE